METSENTLTKIQDFTQTLLKMSDDCEQTCDLTPVVVVGLSNNVYAVSHFDTANYHHVEEIHGGKKMCLQML